MSLHIYRLAEFIRIKWHVLYSLPTATPACCLTVYNVLTCMWAIAFLTFPILDLFQKQDTRPSWFVSLMGPHHPAKLRPFPPSKPCSTSKALEDSPQLDRLCISIHLDSFSMKVLLFSLFPCGYILVPSLTASKPLFFLYVEDSVGMEHGPGDCSQGLRQGNVLTLDAGKNIENTEQRL